MIPSAALQPPTKSGTLPCDVSWLGKNTVLHALHLAPLTAANATVEFKDGVASEIKVMVEVADAADATGRMYPGTGATIVQSAEKKSCNQNYISLIKERGTHTWAIVTMDSCVLPPNRAKALDVNSACLARLGGCRTGAAILPSVFGPKTGARTD